MNKRIRILALAIVIAMITACMPVFAEQGDAPTMETRQMIMYVCDSAHWLDCEVAFFNGVEDIPYFSGETIAYILRTLASYFGDGGYELKDFYTTWGDLEAEGLLALNAVDPEAPVFTMMRENGSFVVIDAAIDHIWMSDRDLFSVNSYAVSGGDLVSSDGLYHYDDNTIAWDDVNDRAQVNLYKRAGNNRFIRMGDVTYLTLSDYSIDIYEVDGTVYVPAATVSDFFAPMPITFNGKDLFLSSSRYDNIAVDENGQTMYDLYYSVEGKDRSTELAEFTYLELCMMLDNCYGLKNEHNIIYGFDDFFCQTGLATQLLSTNVAEYTDALYQLVYGYFGDMHSAIISVSPYSGGDVDFSGGNISISLDEYDRNRQRFAAAREAAGISRDGQIIDGYMEIGDTAFVTFDSFKTASQDYYDQNLWPNFSDIYMSDTISLVVYAQSMIHRADSPIRKVVVDLSLNGGGALDACVYIASWMLGSASISLENVNTGAQYTTTYWVDTNLDGLCTLEDDLGADDLEVYCLISGNSFSCGNLLPVLLKEDGRVTLIGQTTGGGSCVVRHTSTADGTLMQISDFFRLCIVKNGSFYDIDRGVEPDIPLRKPASFYDRNALADYLDTIR